MITEKKFRLPKDIPLEEYPKPQMYLEEAHRLTDEAQKQNIFLRVMGPIALHYYFPDYVELYLNMDRLGERVFTDIDYAAYGKHRSKLVQFFESQGYDIEKRAAMLSGGGRYIFFSDRIPMIDVFFDRLCYNHPIDYRDRLEIHPYCVSLTDLLLQKLQIVQINDKDLKDAMLLLLAAPMSETDKDSINVKYLGKILSDDWGFYHTATTNLGRIAAAIADISVLKTAQKAVIGEKINYLCTYLEDIPKSGKWKGRAKTGTSKQWYNEVSDWE
jgi:hypothetical protein